METIKSNKLRLLKKVNKKKIYYFPNDFKFNSNIKNVESIEDILKICDGSKSNRIGEFTYVITDNYNLIIGRVENKYEMGVKHYNLCYNKKCILGGELKINEKKKTLHFNDLSGTITVKIINILKQKCKNVNIDNYFKTIGELFFTNNSIFKNYTITFVKEHLFINGRQDLNNVERKKLCNYWNKTKKNKYTTLNIKNHCYNQVQEGGFSKIKINYQKLYEKLSKLNKYDVIDNTNDFYDIKSKYLSKYTNFTKKINKLKELRIEANNELNLFKNKIKSHIKIVDNISQVTNGKILLKSSFKTDESIIEKIKRPGILKYNPKYKLEHLRDAFRFKFVVDNIDDAFNVIYLMDKYLFEFNNKNVVKMDIFKLLSPKYWGWRFIAFDLRFSCGLIVECYITLKTMDIQKKIENHKIFEKWRNRHIKKLSKQEKTNMRRDIEKSYNLYYKQFISSINLNNCITSYILLFKLLMNDFNNYLKQLSNDYKTISQMKELDYF
jgi:hypothetical protein